MRRSTLELLACPTCQGSLSLDGAHTADPVDGGTLRCSHCEQRYPIRNGIPQFISSQQLEGLDRRFSKFYDRLSPLYDLVIKAAFLPFGGDRRARKEILDRLELTGGPVLEVSVGTGSNLPYLFESPRLGQAYGLDLSAGQLARCQRRVARQGWPVDLFLGTAEALPFQTGTFDSVFHIGGINFFSNQKKAIEEMIRVARPGTKILIADEAERLAQLYQRVPGAAVPEPGQEGGAVLPLDLVPDTMEDTRLDGIWQSHGKPHGYCLEFRKPA
jgi:ubiquinone/menaquinone biosynthesis C-methylase UbiE